MTVGQTAPLMGMRTLLIMALFTVCASGLVAIALFCAIIENGHELYLNIASIGAGNLGIRYGKVLDRRASS